ncbi:MAG: hypothetical protein H0V61_03555 [Chitinophagales bacterium]|jgi:hypothetical protein|nr:hypothetical protein [Chitinophagales bacterium]
MRNYISKILLLCLVFGVEITAAQTLTFCKSVSKDGEALGAAQTFTVPKNGGTVVFHLQYPSSKPVTSTSFDIYRIEAGKEIFNSTIKQSAEPSKNWLSKEVIIYESGVYRVYVYDQQDQLVLKSKFTVRVAAK